MINLATLVSMIIFFNGSPDINNDGVVNGVDLGTVLGSWGTDNPKSDINEDGMVGAEDLAMILAAWGPYTPEEPEIESLTVLEEMINSLPDKGGVIDLEGRKFAILQDDVIDSKFYLSNDRKNLTVRNGTIAGTKLLDWRVSRKGVYEADVSSIMSDMDVAAYLVDPDVDKDNRPLIAVWPAPPENMNEYRNSRNENWIELIVEQQGIFNGEVYTETRAGSTKCEDGVLPPSECGECDTCYNVNTVTKGGCAQDIVGFKITNPEILGRVNNAIGDYPADKLTIYIHAGPNQIQSASIVSYDKATGKMFFQKRSCGDGIDEDGAPLEAQGLTYYRYLRFSLTGNPDWVQKPREYCIDKSSKKIYYHVSEIGKPDAEISYSKALFYLRGSGCDVSFEDLTMYGIRENNGTGTIVRKSTNDKLVYSVINCDLHSGVAALRGVEGGRVINSTFDRFTRYVIVGDGAFVDKCRFGPVIERNSAVYMLSSRTQDGEIPQTVVTNSYFSLPVAVHGQGISLYMNAWQNCRVEHNIFYNCQRPISFQPAPNPDERSVDVGEAVFSNNLMVVDKINEQDSGQSGFAFNGATDEHLADYAGEQIVRIQNNTMVITDEGYLTRGSINSLRMSLTKLNNCNLIVSNNVSPSIYAATRCIDGENEFPCLSSRESLPQMRANNGLYEYVQYPYRHAWGRTDYPRNMDSESYRIDPDLFDMYHLLPVGEWSTYASDGGPLGVRWLGVPTLDQLKDLPNNWYNIWPAVNTPEPSNLVEVYAKDGS